MTTHPTSTNPASTRPTSTAAIGIDIGGTGIKGALVDTATGELLSDRIKLPTPAGGNPDAIVATTREILALIADSTATAPGIVPVGVCFPAVIKQGRTLSAANISRSWIGLEAEILFAETLGTPIRFVNDADAAGWAEIRFGAAADVPGLLIMTTLGTGIGSAIIHEGVLVPNSELGHLEIDGHDYETRASYRAKEAHNLSWEAWAKRLQTYYRTLEKLFSPDLFIVGGGVSKSSHEFLPLLNLATPIVPAVHRNNSGILGAAALAASGVVHAAQPKAHQK